MKMELLQNLKTCRHLLFVIGFCSFLFSCRGNQKAKGDIGYGKKFYYDKCLSCHNFYSPGFAGNISLSGMSNYDSSSLINKLKDLKNVEIHKNQLITDKYTEKEIYSLFIYIKDYNLPKNK